MDLETIIATVLVQSQVQHCVVLARKIVEAVTLAAAVERQGAVGPAPAAPVVEAAVAVASVEPAAAPVAVDPAPAPAPVAAAPVVQNSVDTVVDKTANL